MECKKGRKKSGIHDHYQLINTNQVKCLYCPQVSSVVPERMEQHIVNDCPQALKEAKEEVSGMITNRHAKKRPISAIVDDADDDVTILSSERSEISPSSSVSQQTSAKAPPQLKKQNSKNNQRKISSFADEKPSDRDTNMSNDALTIALVTGNVPFNFVENEHFRKFLRILHPIYTPPSRRTVMGAVDGVYKTIYAQSGSILRTPISTL
ncbi:hypothetical protein HDU76_008114 [Blyttiomyces sp. JEL0837]|nr:hypothetical protein HDU76_008114 [Blyttiomyces sp. JEL0837]